jgi:hypothetical protein
MITPDEARAALEEIRRKAADDEAAHAAEDRLRSRVLSAVALGSPHSVELAHIALATDDVKFCRWCA